MMSYPNFYDADFYTEASEFDRQVDEFKESLMKGVKAEFIEEMESLRKENAELQEVKSNFESIKKDYKRKENELNRFKSDLEHQVRREHWTKLLKDQEVIMYKAVGRYEQGEKCNTCDEYRYIHYISPQGNPAKEQCNCATRKTVYKPSEEVRYEFAISRGTMTAWYKRSRYSEDSLVIDQDYDGVVAQKVILDSSADFSKLDYRETVFKTEEDCQAYCDYLQAKEDKSEAE